MIEDLRSKEKRRPDKTAANWEVIVKNLPENLYKEDLVHFMWKTMDSCRGLTKPGNPIIYSQHFKNQGNILVIRFRSYEEAVNCLLLDRIYYGKKVLSMTSKYLTVPTQTTMLTSKLKTVSKKANDNFNKVYVGNFPLIPEHEVMNYLSEYGQLKSFEQIQKDNTSQCFCQYINSDETEEIIKKLNGLKVKGRPIIAKRAALMNTAQTNRTKITSKLVNTSGHNSRSSRFQKDLNDFYVTFDTQGYFANKKISCVLILKDIIPYTNLKNVEPIINDIKEQVKRIGPLVKIIHKNLNVYIEYERVQYAQIAYLLLNSRKYDGKNLNIAFYDPIKFADDILL